ncbi:MAG: glycosyltransferase family 9 protein [Oligoflexia bacterium]|nr:glycosyltransferase family 9 protein [Oligoflexia bacterium]
MKILILRFSSMGDIAMATALPRVLRNKFPDAVIDMAVRSDFHDLIEWNSYIDNKIYLGRHEGFRGLVRLLNKIHKAKYDLVIDAHRSLRSRFICTFLPIVSKVFFNKRTLKRLALIYFKLNLFKKVDLNMIEYIKPLAKRGVVYDDRGTEIFIPDDVSRKISGLIGQKTSATGHKKLIGIVPGAQWPGKRWPVEHFTRLVALINRNVKATIIVIGGPKDTFCNYIAEGNKNAFAFAGDFSIIESAAALSMCEVVISNDTGMMHVAEAVGTDVIGIMGPTSFEFGCYPYRKNSMVVEKKMWCRPCSKNGWGPCIRFGKRPCLNNITAEEVFAALKTYLAEGGTNP